MHGSDMACIKISTIVFLIFLTAYIVLFKVEANECFYDHDCSFSNSKKYCCVRNYPELNICQASCVGETCFSDYHCADEEVCCNSVCRSDCVGVSCVSENDCANGECCDSDDKCRKEEDCGISVIVVVVISIAVAGSCACFCCVVAVSKRRAHGGVIVRRPPTTVVGAQQRNEYYPMQPMQKMYSQSSQPHPTQPPPAYQPQRRAYPPPVIAYEATRPTAIPSQTEVSQQ